MNTQFAFRAHHITRSLPSEENFVTGNGSLVNVIPASNDPISDAINNVRFACVGFAPEDSFVSFQLRTFHTFRFRPQSTGRLTAHAHFTPQGAYSAVVKRRSSGWFFEWPADVFCHLLTRMRVRVIDANGSEVLRSSTPFSSIFHAYAQGNQGGRLSREGVVDAHFLDFFHTRSFSTIVGPSDTIEVQARYITEAWAQGGAEFLLDFGSIPSFANEAGDGLNSPLAVINISD